MPDYCLKNQSMEIHVHSMGAELFSLKKGEVEYLWQGDPAYWNRTSPVLFPQVGKVRDGKYRHEGKTYELGQHGFARDMEFDLLSQTDSELCLELTDTEETRKVYPFAFRLRIAYELTEDSVVVKWEVKNPSDRKMYFAIGAHPAFFCPLNGEGKAEDYTLLLMKNGAPVSDVQSTIVAPVGLTEHVTERFDTENGLLPISEKLFLHDTLVLENRQATSIAIKNPSGENTVTVEFDAPVVAVWTPNGRDIPFLCIEPWYGRCDSVDFDGELPEKEWENMLSPDEVFSAHYKIEV